MCSKPPEKLEEGEEEQAIRRRRQKPDEKILFFGYHQFCNRTTHMNWIILIIAGFFESGFAFCLGKMKGLSGTAWTLWGIGFLLCLTLSMVLLAKAVQTLPISIAYPVWTGIGAVGTVVLGIVCFREPATLPKLFFTFTLIASIVGLKMV